MLACHYSLSEWVKVKKKEGASHERWDVTTLQITFDQPFLLIFNAVFCLAGSWRWLQCEQNELEQELLTMLSQSIIQNISHSVFSFMYNLLCVSSQGESSWSDLIKRKQERSPQKMGTFYNFNRLRSKSKTFYFPLYLSNNDGQINLVRINLNWRIVRIFSRTDMYGESNEKLRRWPWST